MRGVRRAALPDGRPLKRTGLAPNDGAYDARATLGRQRGWAGDAGGRKARGRFALRLDVFCRRRQGGRDGGARWLAGWRGKR